MTGYRALGRCLCVCSVPLTLLPAPSALAEDTKAALIEQFMGECRDINTQRGLGAPQVEALCACEAQAVEAHYGAFSHMVSEDSNPDTEPPPEAELHALREAIRRCQSAGG